MALDQSNRELGILVEWDSEAGVSRVDQLESAVREALRAGRLKPGSRLPSSRDLARHLGCSRWVVVQAFEQLVAEGRLEARVGSGTWVPPQVDDPVAWLPQPVRGKSWRYDFRTGVPDLALFPRDSWLRAARKGLADAAVADLDYGDPSGLPALKVALAEYLGRARGAHVMPDRVSVTNGVVQGLSIIARALAQIGIRRVGVEHPGWIPLRAPFDGSGVRTVSIATDHDGLVVDALASANLRAVLVTPAHTFPGGATMSAERRNQLLEWAERVNGVIIEDDYDAEFRYDRHPFPTLQMESPDRVILVGSVSKSLAPALRIGWLVAPVGYASRIQQARRSSDSGAGIFSQVTLAEFVASHSFERHLRMMRHVYAARRSALVAALHAEVPSADVIGVPAGLHLMIDFPSELSGDAIAKRAAESDVRVYPASRYAMKNSENAMASGKLVLGFGSISERGIREGVAVLSRIASGKSG